MGLLALPALWLGKGGNAVMHLMLDAVCSMVSLDAAYASVPLLAGQIPTQFFKARRGSVGDAPPEWEEFTGACDAMGGTVSKTALLPSPSGKLCTLRLVMGAGSARALVCFASRRADFPTAGETAFLRAAVSLAASGLNNARSEHERDMANRAKDEFLAMLGHELRNPLAPIVTTMALIRMKDSAHLARELEVIERQVGHLSRLVDDLLDITRITRDRVELRREILDMRVLVAEAVEGVSPLLEERQHEIVVHAKTEAFVDGDPARIRQVLSNLLINAAKYTPPQGRIAISASVDASRVVVAVQDNGLGIDPALLPKIFGLFQQGETTIDRSRGGLGIGLAIVRKLVELHGGTISAASDGVGKGSRFEVAFPLAGSPKAAVTELASITAPTTAPSVMPTQCGARILLVDDNVDALQTMAELLSMIGYEVQTAKDPAEALSKAPSFAPDVYVLDIGLPGLNGYQLAAELRRTGGPEAQAARYVALTGYGLASDKALTAQAGFHAHLVKPVELDDLIGALPAIA